MQVGPRAAGDEGASDVLGVLLVVAITIVLSAVVATVALDMGGGVERTVLAGATVTFDAEDDRVRVVFTAMQRPGTRLHVTLADRTDGSTAGWARLDRVGDAHVFEAGVTDGHNYEVVVVAEWHRRRSVVLIESGDV